MNIHNYINYNTTWLHYRMNNSIVSEQYKWNLLTWSTDYFIVQHAYIHNITLFHNKYRTHQYMSIGMNRALLIHGISNFRNGCVWQHIHFHWLTVPVNWHVTTLCGSRKARLRWAFLLWHTNEGYPAQACPRQHIDASYLGANTLATAVWVPVVINGLSDIVCMWKRQCITQTDNDWSI